MTILNDNFDLAALKALPQDQLPELCHEIRDVLIDTVSHNGGHLASNLGAVEITVSIDRVFDSPKDAVIFDVGHQSYTHKLLTGRYSSFGTLRKNGGISGFPKPQESVHDQFVEGHAGPSLSEGIGLAKSKLLNGDSGKVIVVIGDGSFTNGMVYEAMNNLSTDLKNFIVILNDNSMSISKSVGSLAKYLLKIRTGTGYSKMKSNVQTALDRIPLVGTAMSKALVSTKTSIRRSLYDGALFEELGFRYVGPIDGNNIDEMCYILSNVKNLEGPILLHAITSKGKGYKLAEKNPGAYHGVGKFDIEQGNPDIAEAASYSNVFGKKLAALGKRDPSIVAVTAAMKYGTGLNFFAHAFKDRFFDTGITEGHAAAFCAGLAKGGNKPYFAVYSTFLQRCYDQIFQDIILNNVNVTLCIDRAGFVGEDGETHNGLLDAAMLNSLGKVYTVSPSNYDELRFWIEELNYYTGPKAIRYPRGDEPANLADYMCTGKEFDCIGSSSDTLVITYGKEFSEVLPLKEKADVDLLKLNTIIPIPEEAVKNCLKYRHILFAEEGILHGGIGETFRSMLDDAGFNGTFTQVAVEDIRQKQATVKECLVRCGLDTDSLLKKIEEIRTGGESV